MNRFQLLRRSLAHHWRSHLGLFFSAMVATAVLIGALLVGDSVRGSLRVRAERGLRLPPPAGIARIALATGDRFFTDDSFLPQLEKDSRLHAYGGTVLPMTISRADGTARVTTAQWIHPRNRPGGSLAGNHPAATRGFWLNASLARSLRCVAGDEIVVRIRKPSALPGDAILTPKENQVISRRLEITGILPEGTGDLQLQSGAEPAFNAFDFENTLADLLELPRRFNLLLVAPTDPKTTDDQLIQWTDESIQRSWRLDDVNLKLSVRTNATGAFVELSSDRIFHDVPGIEIGGRRPVSVLTYLVNSLRKGEKLTPYSMVSASEGGGFSADLRPGEMVLNQWLADDLKAGPGDEIEMAHYRLDSAARLQEVTNRFRVTRIVPLSGEASDRTLMPEFPGLSKAESTHDWDAGFELIHKIRDHDEAYWKQHRGAPKAWVSWDDAQRMWANRFGDRTAVRYAIAATDTSGELEKVTRETRSRMDPRTSGLRWDAIAAKASAGIRQGQDFGQLFLAFSFFLIASALGLVGLVARLSVEQRRPEVGSLLAMGWAPGNVGRTMRREFFWVALLGTVPGVLLGMLYAAGIIAALRSIWSQAVAGTGLGFYSSPATLGIGWFSAAIVIWTALWWSLRRMFLRSTRELLHDNEDATPAGNWSARKLGWAIAPAAFGVGMAVWAATQPASQSAPIFFGSGFLILVAGILFYRGWLMSMTTGVNPAHAVDWTTLASRAPARRPSRSLTTVGLLASAAFLVLAVGANKLDAARDGTRRTSGTGGFAYWGESSLPVTQDLNTARGREFFGLDERKLTGSAVVAMRLRPGDDASCLNLQRAQKPRLLGVPTEMLAERGAFGFTKTLSGTRDSKTGWMQLKEFEFTKASPPEIPVLGDANSLQWALHLKVGDVIDDIDERGVPFRMRIVGAVANSIWQGALILDEQAFVRRFPSDVGARVFLVDAAPEVAAQAGGELTRGLGDLGFSLTPTVDRLNRFNAVQNTYLDTFQVLGGLGLILGSIGLGVVAARNLNERRGERGLLRAVGFPPDRITGLVRQEHSRLLWMGLLLGAVAAAVALIPVWVGASAGLAFRNATWLLGLSAVNGWFWMWLTTRRAGNVEVLGALRGE